MLVFGLGLVGFVSGPLGVREQMCCWWWDCGKVHWAGGPLGFFYFVVLLSDCWVLLGLTQVGWPWAVSPGRWRRGLLMVCEGILWAGLGCG